jgi:hypothetical protein
MLKHAYDCLPGEPGELGYLGDGVRSNNFRSTVREKRHCAPRGLWGTAHLHSSERARAHCEISGTLAD